MRYTNKEYSNYFKNLEAYFWVWLDNDIDSDVARLLLGEVYWLVYILERFKIRLLFTKNLQVYYSAPPSCTSTYRESSNKIKSNLWTHFSVR